ncbi:MAG: hypothetical protein J6B48_01490, partial [Clostridia bacterium]|nr:hypothetical protein [Clostridia bacterium]
TIRMENLQMCKKEKYEKHRNVLASFFASAMLVILNSQKLSLRTSNRRRDFFLYFYRFCLFMPKCDSPTPLENLL